MFKNAYAPVAIITFVLGTAAIGKLLYRTACAARPGLEHGWTASRLSYDGARAKLLHSPRWHVIDSQSTTCFWVTYEPRLAGELEHVVLVRDRQKPWQDRRGIVRVQPMTGTTTHVVLDEDDTSYWRVICDVHVAGDPDLVAEVALYLAADAGP